jgi:hypothetical protein
MGENQQQGEQGVLLLSVIVAQGRPSQLKAYCLINIYYGSEPLDEYARGLVLIDRCEIKYCYYYDGSEPRSPYLEYTNFDDLRSYARNRPSRDTFFMFIIE